MLSNISKPVKIVELPCPCRVGPGRELAFTVIREAIDNLCKCHNLPVYLGTLAACDDFPTSRGTFGCWILDFKSREIEALKPEKLLHPVKTALLMLKGKGTVDAVMKDFIRTKVIMEHRH